MSDRTVHGVLADGTTEIVRYDRAGKWYFEPREGKRRQVVLEEAARAASLGTHYANQYGGQAFNARVRQIKGRA